MLEETQTAGQDLTLQQNPFDLVLPTQELPTDDAGAEEELIRYGYRVGDFNILIEPGTTSELIKKPAVFSVPRSPEWYLGLINLRGNLISTIDINSIFNNDSSNKSGVDVLVLDKSENAVGIVIEGLPKTVKVSNEAVEIPELPQQLYAYVENAYAVDDTVWLEFDHKAFLKHIVKTS